MLTINKVQINKWRQVIQMGYIPPQDQKLLSPYNKILQELTIKENIILRRTTLVISSTLRNKRVQLADDDHQGVVKTRQYTCSYIWFPGMNTLTNTTLQHSHICQVANNAKQQEPLKMTTPPEASWTNFRVDHFAPLLYSHYILVV